MAPTILKGSAIFKVALGFAWLALASGCVMNRDSSDIASFEAEGIYVRHLRLRLAPSHKEAFEAMIRRCSEAAERSNLPESHRWVAYREIPGRYWLLTFSDTNDGFVVPETLEGFVNHFGRAEGESAQAEIAAMLAALEYETEWEVLFQQKLSWSTVDEMQTATHPKARIIDRSIRPGMEAAFDAALVARTAFLVDHEYPLPVEGFAFHSAGPRRSWQVVFPTDWAAFHAKDSFVQFVVGLDEAAQGEYAALTADLMATMMRAEFYDADHVREMSYQSD